MTKRTRSRRSSIRARLIRQLVAAILGLLMSYAAVTLAAITLHLYRDVEFDTRMILGNILSQRRKSIAVVLDAYSRGTDPRIWVIGRTRVIDRSPNAWPSPPEWPYTGLLWNPVRYQLTRTVNHTTFVIDWSLLSDAVLLRNLSVVVLFVTLAGMGAGIVSARWTTHRALVPLRSLTLGVRSMLDQGRIMPISMSFGRDEFYHLAGLLNRLLSDLEERRERDQALLADATHHLRTPMAVIRGNIDLVKDGNIDPTVREESLAAIDRTVHEMSRLVDELLAMEHAHNLPHRLLMPMDIHTMAKEVYDDARAIASDTINLAFDEHSAGSTWVWAYPEFARRALWAILENAIQYCAPIAGQISMRLLWDTPSGYLGILVQNNGKGIPAHEMPLIFGRFYRGESARAMEGGTGLGLSLAQSLMHAQHGTVGMTSTEGTTKATLWFRQWSFPESGRNFLQT